MNILFIHQDSCLYGASRSLLALVEELAKRGHSCFVLLPCDGPLVAALTERKIKNSIVRWKGWTCVEGTNGFRRLIGGFRDHLKNHIHLGAALRALDGFRPDIVHTNSSKTAFGAMLAAKIHKPHVWHFREFLGGEFSTGIVFRFGSKLAQRYISKHSNTAIFISKALQAEYPYICEADRKIVYNGVMTRCSMGKLAVDLPGATNGELVLAYVGRLDEWKQPLVALEAVKMLRSQGFGVRLLVAGGGRKEDIVKTQRFVETEGIKDSVNFLGVVDDVGPVYKQSHVFIMPSRGDAFGRVTAEAMAYGRPVIGANAGATPELVRDGYNGLIFPAGDAAALASAIMRLGRDRELLARLAANARESAQTYFTNEKYAEEILQVYTKISTEKSLPNPK